MLSLTAHARIPTSNHRVSSFKARLLPALLSARKSTKPDNNCHKSLNLSFRLKEKRRALKLDSCGSHQGDGDEELEAEMMNFMAQSEKTTDSDIAEFQRRIESCKQSGSSSFLRATPQNLDSPHLAGSSSLETSQHHAADEDSGIDGMLSRLEKQRNSDLSGIKLRKNGYKAQTRSKDEGNDRHSDTSLGFGGTNLEENTRKMHAYHPKGTLDSSGDNIRHYTEPETWRSWMDRRAGFPLTEFEAAEISLEKYPVDTNNESYHEGITITTKYAEDLDEHKEINYNEVRTRLWGLESELTTALRSIRSRREDNISKEVIGSSTELQSLSDAVEFQENEVMSAKQRLRSLRAKLAVLEGKITLATTEAQKIVEVKQKRIGDARKSLQLLRTTSIEWPNSAAQVLLAGSFDGWKTQRRMRRSKLGVFSITLMLYPGSYEIKFIADGNWKLDPLRPTINSNGYINNLFIVS
ncbi:hypothetical protein SASPL_107718 [Salvia splendens]|uniref:AMP-activated protein kinase glycogen-binding domain-containing protein n=1 Tax=Salvia splendens TaxID=180675 RepID=A0A8X8YBP4_SALSN|nr:protein PTST homolog 2, chloroplastic-like isoform X1 [Salvia splendens]KAG6429666.1 hypothetical protein SASPL_107718 [Salvia splendens]